MRNRAVGVLMGLVLALAACLPTAVFGAALEAVDLELVSAAYTVSAGSSGTWDVTVRNTNPAAATVTGVSGSAAGVTVTTDSMAQNIPGSGTGTVRVYLQAASATATATANVQLTISYKISGTEYYVRRSAAITVQGQPAAPDLPQQPQQTEPPTPPPTTEPAPPGTARLALISPATSVSMAAGGSYAVDVTLKNSGTGNANNIDITVPPNKSFSVSLANGKLSPFSLTRGMTRTFTLTVKPEKNLAAGDYTVHFDYTFTDETRAEKTGGCDVFIKVEKPGGDDAAANVTLTDVAADKSAVAPGEEFTLSMNVRNSGGGTATNVNVSIENLKADGLTAVNSVNARSLGTLKKGEGERVSFKLKPAAKMKGGSAEVSLKLAYRDAEGKDVTSTLTYFVTVTGAGSDDGRAVVEITNISAPTSALSVGQAGAVTVAVKNSGDKTAKAVSVKASPEAGVVPRSANTQMVNSLAPGETKTLAFSFAPTNEAKTQNYSVSFTVDYQTGETDEAGAAKKDSFMQYAGLDVYAPPTPSPTPDAGGKMKSVPKIIISKYVIDPLIVQAGHEFDIDLTFQNTHPSKTVNNITVKLTFVATETEKGSVFTPVDASNIFYIPAIASKAETTEHIRMYVVPDAKAKNYILSANFEYEDDEGNQLTSAAEFGVNVKQVTKLELGDIYFPTNAAVGQQQYVGFSVHNTGKVTLNNLKIKIEGKGIDNTSAEQIFGNFASGSYDYYDGNFTPTEPGETTLRLVVAYDDDTGEHIEQVTEYPVVIEDMMGGGMDGMGGGMMLPDGMDGSDGMTEQQAFVKILRNKWFWVGIGVIVIGLGGGAVAAVKKWKRRKAEREDQ